MIEWIKAFLWDRSAFERYTRALLLGFASGWSSYTIEGNLTKQGLMSAIVMALAGMIGAGEKNEAKSG